MRERGVGSPEKAISSTDQTQSGMFVVVLPQKPADRSRVFVGIFAVPIKSSTASHHSFRNGIVRLFQCSTGSSVTNESPFGLFTITCKYLVLLFILTGLSNVIVALLHHVVSFCCVICKLFAVSFAPFVTGLSTVEAIEPPLVPDMV